MTRFLHSRPGTTLIELLIFVAILALVVSALLPLLFTATEDRLLQQTVSIVEQNGTQMMQSIAYRVRHAESILSPGIQGTGAVLVLQTSSGATNPAIFGVSTGALVQITHTTREVISASQVAVTNFVVRNTSVSSTRQSVYVTFTVSRTIRLQAPRIYSRTFEAVFTLYPADVLHAEACGSCAAPSCGHGGYYVWQVCEASSCLTAQTMLRCP